jgi:hypothetical protein
MHTSITSTPKTGTEVLATIQVDNHRSRTVHRVLLLCGILSSLYYVVLNSIVPLHYPGYSVVSQTVSELSAIDAPTRQLWVFLCTFYSVLVIAFGCGVWLCAGTSRPLRIAGAMMLVYGVSGFFWPPMHQREVLAAGGETPTDIMHIAFSMATVLFMMLMMAFGAAGFNKRFRLFTVASFILFVVFGTLTGLDAPKISKDLPTPLIGIWERINIGIFLLWVVVFAILLWRRENKQVH